MRLRRRSGLIQAGGRVRVKRPGYWAGVVPGGEHPSGTVVREDDPGERGQRRVVVRMDDPVRVALPHGGFKMWRGGTFDVADLEVLHADAVSHP